MTNRKNWVCALSVGPQAVLNNHFPALADAGILEVELSSGGIAPYETELDFVRRAKEYTALAKQSGVTISSIHLPFAPFARMDPAAFDTEIRTKLIEDQKALILAAAQAGIGIAVIHPSGEPYTDEERPERLKIACDTIAVLSETAHGAGITLALENLPRTCLCRTSDEMLYFLSQIPDLRVCFDTNHSLREDNAHYIRAVGDKIVTLHVSDYDFIDEKHWLPGEGKNDWNAILSALEEVGYNGRFLYEIKMPENGYAGVRANYDRVMA